MADTALAVSFTVQDAFSDYDIVGTSDNYSFKRTIPGVKLVEQDGDTASVNIDLEGNYGEFTVRVYAKSNLGIRSEFLEKKISIPAPKFHGTFTFGELRFDGVPEGAAQNSLVVQSPSQEENLYAVDGEFVNNNAKIVWGLVPPVGHPLEGKLVKEEILTDPFFKNFEITFYDGSQTLDQVMQGTASPITTAQLNNIPELQNRLLADDVGAALRNYKDFEFEISSEIYKKLFLDEDVDSRRFSAKVVGFDSFNVPFTGVLAGQNRAPIMDFFIWNLEKGVFECNGLSNDADWIGMNLYRFSSDGDEVPTLENRKDYKAAQAEDGLAITKEKYFYSREQLESEDEKPKLSQTFNKNYFYAVAAVDGLGEGPLQNITADGLSMDGNLIPIKYSLKIGYDLFRESSDDLIFEWKLIDNFGDVVDIEEYSRNSDDLELGQDQMALASYNGILGFSGALIDSSDGETIMGYIGASEDNKNDKTNYTLQTSYRYSREFNNAIYGDSSIRESGKRDIDLHLSLVDSEKEVIHETTIYGRNPAPKINFLNVDSLRSVGHIDFDFVYAGGSREKTTKVDLFRNKASSLDDRNFDIDAYNEIVVSCDSDSSIEGAYKYEDVAKIEGKFSSKGYIQKVDSGPSHEIVLYQGADPKYNENWVIYKNDATNSILYYTKYLRSSSWYDVNDSLVEIKISNKTLLLESDGKHEGIYIDPVYNGEGTERLIDKFIVRFAKDSQNEASSILNQIEVGGTVTIEDQNLGSSKDYFVAGIGGQGGPYSFTVNEGVESFTSGSLYVDSSKKYFVQTFFGEGKQSFGNNITSIEDDPPFTLNAVDGEEEITPYYYKVLPYDSYGSGYLHHIQEKAYVYPYAYYDGSQKYPGSVDTGPPLPITGFRDDSTTSFETYFLSWNASSSPDVSHYEIWMSDDPSLVDTQQGADSFRRINEINSWEPETLYNPGDWISGKKNGQSEPKIYQCLEPHYSEHQPDSEDIIITAQNNFWDNHGDTPTWKDETLRVYGQAYKSLYSKHDGFSVVETESQKDGEGYSYLTQLPTDPAENLLKNKNPAANGRIAITVPANQNSLRLKGKTNEVKYFWVRTVDKARNKSLFFPDPSNGFRMALGQAKVTDLEDFEQGITEQFENTIALIPNNPFVVDSVDGRISWGTHYLYNKGVGYLIEASGINIDPTDDGGVPNTAPHSSNLSIEHNLQNYINDTHPIVLDDNNFDPADYTRTDLKEKLKDEFQATDKFFIYWTPRDTKELNSDEATSHGTKKDEGENTRESLTVTIQDVASDDVVKLSIAGTDTTAVSEPSDDNDAAAKLATIINATANLDASISASADNNVVTISGGEGVSIPPVNNSSTDANLDDLVVTVSPKTFHAPDGIATDTNDITNPLKTVEKKAIYRFSHANPSNLAIVSSTKHDADANDEAHDRIVYDYQRIKLDQPSDNSLMQEGDFVVAQFVRGVGIKQAFHAFANAVIGSASIADAAITSAKIKDLIADKVRAGTIGAEDIRVYGGTRASTSERINFEQPIESLNDYVAGAGAWGTIGSSIDGTVGWDDFPFSQVNKAGDRAIEYKKDQVVTFSNPTRGYFKAVKDIGATVKKRIQVVDGEKPDDIIFLRPESDDLIQFEGRNKFALDEGSLVVPSENIIVEKVLNAGNATLNPSASFGWTAQINGTSAPPELQGSVTITFTGTAPENATLDITVQQIAMQPSHAPGGAGEAHWTRIDNPEAGESQPGFYIRGDGSFSFQAKNGVLKFEDGELVIEGNIRQTSGATFGLVALVVSSNIVTYDEWNQLSTRTPKVIDANASFQNPAGEVVHHGIKWQFDISDPEGSQGGDRKREVYRLAFEEDSSGVNRARIKVALYLEDSDSNSGTFGLMVFDKEEDYDPTAAGYIGSGNTNFNGISSKHFLKLDGGTSNKDLDFEGTGSEYQEGILADFYAIENKEIVEPYSGAGKAPRTPKGDYVVTQEYQQGDTVIAPTTYGANGVFIYINPTASLGKPVTNSVYWRQLFHRNFGINDGTQCSAQLYTTALQYRSNATLTIQALDIGDSTAAIYKDAESFGQSVFFINPLDGTAIKNKNKDQKLELQTVWQYENNLPMDLYYDADITNQQYHGGGWSLRNYEEDLVFADQVSLFYRFAADTNGTLSGDLQFYYISLRDLMFTDGDDEISCSLTSGNSTVSLSAGESTNSITVGQRVSGSGIQSGTRVKSIGSSTEFTLTKNANASGAKTLTFLGDLPTYTDRNDEPSILKNYKKLSDDFPSDNDARDNVISRLKAIRTDVFPGRYGPSANADDGRAAGVEEVHEQTSDTDKVWQNNNKYNVRIGRDAIEDQLLVVAASEPIDVTNQGQDYVDPITKLPILLSADNYARTPINSSGDLEALDSITLSDVLDGGAAGFLEVDKPLSIIRGKGKGALDETNKRTLTAQFSRDGETSITDYATAYVWAEALEGDDNVNLFVQLETGANGKTSSDDNQSGQGSISNRPSLHIHTAKITAADSKGNEYSTTRSLKYKINRGTPQAPQTLASDPKIDAPWQVGYTYYDEGAETSWTDGDADQWQRIFHLRTHGASSVANLNGVPVESVQVANSSDGSPNSVSVEFQFTDPNTKRTIFAQETIYIAEGGDSERGIVLGASTQTVILKRDNSIIPNGGVPTWSADGTTATYEDTDPIRVFARVTNLLPSEQSGYSLGAESGKHLASVTWEPPAGLELYSDQALNTLMSGDGLTVEITKENQIVDAYVKPSQIKTLEQATIKIISERPDDVSVAQYDAVANSSSKNPYGDFQDELSIILLEEGTDNLTCLLDNEAASFEAQLVWEMEAQTEATASCTTTNGNRQVDTSGTGFAVGQDVSGPGIQSGSKVTQIVNGGFKMNKTASSSGTNNLVFTVNEQVQTYVVEDSSLSGAQTDVFMWEGSVQLTPLTLNDSSTSIAFEHSPKGTNLDEIVTQETSSIIYWAIFNREKDSDWWGNQGVTVRSMLATFIADAENKSGTGNDPILTNGTYWGGVDVVYRSKDITHSDIPVGTFYIDKVEGTNVVPANTYTPVEANKKWASGIPTSMSKSRHHRTSLISYTINYRNIKGDTGSLVKTQTFSRANSGVVPYSLSLEATSLVVGQQEDLTITPGEIIITANCVGFEGDIDQLPDLSGGPGYLNDLPQRNKVIWDLYSWDDQPLLEGSDQDINNNPIIEAKNHDSRLENNQIIFRSSGKRGLERLFLDSSRPLDQSWKGQDKAGIKIKAWTVAPDGRTLSDEVVIQKLKEGTSAKTLRLESSSYVIKRLKDADLTPTSITFTAHTPNIPLAPHDILPSRIDGHNPETVTDTNSAHLHKSNISWHLIKKDGTDFSAADRTKVLSSCTIAVDNNNGVGTLTITNINSEDNRAVLANGFKIRAVVKDPHFEAGKNLEQWPSDSTTVQVLDEGLDAISVVNSNENHTLTANEFGQVSDYTGSGTAIQVYEGATALTYVSSVAASDKSKWTVTASSPGDHITPNANPSGQNGNTATYGVASGLNNDQEAATITYQITGRKANGDEFATSTTQTFSKSRGAVSPITVVLSNSAHQLTADKDGAVTFYDGSGTTITVYQGADKLIYDATPTAAGQWEVSASNGVNINVGAINYANNVGTVLDASNAVSGEDSPYIDFTITGKTLQNTSINQVVRQQFSKSKQSNIAGPAIVFRGDWGSKLEYFYFANNDQITRRDVVKYNGAYYMNKAAIPANDGGNADPTADTTRWEGMGASFNSVSTGLEMVDESFVKNTLTMEDDAELIVNADGDDADSTSATLHNQHGTNNMSGAGEVGWYLDGNGNVTIGRNGSSMITYVSSGHGTDNPNGVLTVNPNTLTIQSGGTFLGSNLDTAGKLQRSHIGTLNINDLSDVDTDQGMPLAHGKGIVYNAEAATPRWEVGDAGGKVKVQSIPPADAEEGHLWWDTDYAALYVALVKDNQINWVRAIPEF